jgi:hypothetical protein
MVAGLLFLVDVSCAKMVPVPESGLEKNNAGNKRTYRITTRDNLIYEFKEFEATDSTLVILGVTSFGRNPSLHDASKIKAPVIVSWNDVESIERIEPNYFLTVLVAAAAGAALYGITVIFFGVGFY